MTRDEESAAQRSEIALLRRENLRLSEELQAAGEKTHELLALLLHDIRNPLAEISSGLALLAREQTPAADKQMIFSLLKRRISGLSALLNEVLGHIAMESSAVNLQREEIVLDEIIVRATEAAAALLEEANLRLKIVKSGAAPPARIFVNAETFETGLMQLLAHAANSAPSGIEIPVTLAYDAAALIISVPQYGRGIRLLFIRQAMERLGGSFHVEPDAPGQKGQLVIRIPANGR